MKIKMAWAAATLAASIGAMAAAKLDDAWASTRGPESPEAPDHSTLAADRAMTEAILKEAQTGGYAAIASQEAALQAILAHAPTRPRTVSANGAILYRAIDFQDCLIGLAAVIGAPPPGGTPRRNAACVDNPYPMAALTLGSFYNETGRPELALAALNAGLLWRPGYPALVAEKAQSLVALRRLEEALAAYAQGLSTADGDPRIGPSEKALLLRGEGFVLTELNRLDEAERAYRASLELDTTHGHAKDELVYIARLKAGGARTQPASVSELSGVKPK